MISQREMITRNYFIASKNMKTKIFLICITFILFSFSEVLAIEAPKNLRVSDSDNNSITIDWESVPGAIWYYHYLGTGSGNYIDGIDLIDDTEYTISDIDSAKTYYISVTSVDEFGIESEYAEEVSYWAGISSVINSSWFRVSDVEILDPTTLEVSFSRDLNLETGATREFILEKKETGIETFIALSQISEANGRNIIIILDSPLQTETEYEFVVLEIQDTDGNNIESGIDSFISFTTPKSFAGDDEVVEDETFNLDSAWNIPTTIIEDTSDTNTPNVTSGTNTDSSTNNTTPVDTNQNSQMTKWNVGVTLNNEDVANIVITAEENTKLPKTWPEHWLLVFLAMMVAGWFLYRFKK